VSEVGFSGSPAEEGGPFYMARDSKGQPIRIETGPGAAAAAVASLGGGGGDSKGRKTP
jgi:hypothetical protein